MGSRSSSRSHPRKDSEINPTRTPTIKDDASLKILNVHALRGPNIWSNSPILEAWIDVGVLKDVSSEQAPGFNARLMSWLPTMIEHRCSVGERGGFFKRLERGTYPSHILEHVALELQSLAGTVVGYGKARAMNQDGLYRVVVRFTDEVVGRASLDEARSLLLAAYDGGVFDVAAAIERLHALAAPATLDAGAIAVMNAAKARGIPTIGLNREGLVQLGVGSRQRRMHLAGLASDQTSAVAEELVSDIALYRPLLRAAGVPVPWWREVESAEEAWDAAESIGLPVVIRPLYSDSCLAHLPRLLDREQVQAAYEKAVGTNAPIMVEQAIEGQSYRLLVWHGRLIACAADPPAEALGCHPAIEEMAMCAARVLGLDTCEIELIARSLEHPLLNQGGAIVAVRSRPALARFLPADPDQAIAHAQTLLRPMFGEHDTGRIPIVAVVGGQERRGVAEAAVALLRSCGYVVGSARAGAALVNGQPLPGHWHGLFDATRALLMNPLVEAMVVELGRRDVLTEGLGFDRCAVAVVTGLDTDAELPLRDWGFDEPEEQLIRAERCVVEVVEPHGHALLNGSDARVAAMAEYASSPVKTYQGDPLPAIRDALRIYELSRETD